MKKEVITSLVLNNPNWNMKSKPTISVVVPVFNQEKVIEETLDSIIYNMKNSFELLIIDDSSTDGTFKAVINFCNEIIFSDTKLSTIKIFKSKNQVFETYCDYVGIEASCGTYILEIQADMKLLEMNFDENMRAALEQHPNLFMISGRGTMPFDEILTNYKKSMGNEAISDFRYSSRLFKRLKSRFSSTNNVSVVKTTTQFNSEEPQDFLETGKAGRLGRAINERLEIQRRKLSILYSGQTVMRGPIIFEKSRYSALGGLNHSAFFLGYDEHDLILRAWKEFGWRVAYLPVDFESPLEIGSMRKKRNYRTRKALRKAALSAFKNRENSYLYLAALNSEIQLPANSILKFDRPECSDT